MPTLDELVNDEEFKQLPMEDAFRAIDTLIVSTAPETKSDQEARELVGLSNEFKRKAFKLRGPDGITAADAGLLKLHEDRFQFTAVPNPRNEAEDLFSYRVKPNLRLKKPIIEVSIGGDVHDIELDDEEDFNTQLREGVRTGKFGEFTSDQEAGLTQVLGNPDGGLVGGLLRGAFNLQAGRPLEAIEAFQDKPVGDVLNSVQQAIGEMGRGFGGLVGNEGMQQLGGDLVARGTPIATDSTGRQIFQAGTKELTKLGLAATGTKGLGTTARVNAIAAIQTAPITGDIFQESFKHFKEQGDENARSKAIVEAGSRAAVMFAMERYVGGVIFGNSKLTNAVGKITPAFFGKLRPVTQRAVAGMIAEGGTESIQEAADLIAQDIARDQSGFKEEMANLKKVITSDEPLKTSQTLFAGAVGAFVGGGAGTIVSATERPAVEPGSFEEAYLQAAQEIEKAGIQPEESTDAPQEPSQPVQEGNDVEPAPSEVGTGGEVQGEVAPEPEPPAPPTKNRDTQTQLQEAGLSEEDAISVARGTRTPEEVGKDPDQIEAARAIAEAQARGDSKLVPLKDGGEQKGFKSRRFAAGWLNRQPDAIDRGLFVEERDGRFFVREPVQETQAEQPAEPEDPQRQAPPSPAAATTPETQVEEVVQVSGLDRPADPVAGVADSSETTRDAWEEIAQSRQNVDSKDLKVVDSVLNDRKTFKEVAKEQGISEEEAQKRYRSGLNDLQANLSPEARGILHAREPRATSTMNEIMNQEREARGDQAILPGVAQNRQDSIDIADKRLADNPSYLEDLKERINSGLPGQGVDAADEMILLFHKRKLMNERTAAGVRASDIHATEEARTQAKKQWTEIEGQIAELDTVTNRAGTLSGRALQARKAMLREDFSFEVMEQKARATKGGSLTPEESAKLQEQANRIEELEAQLAEAQDRAEEATRTRELERHITDLTKGAQQRGEISHPPAIIAMAEKINERIQRSAQAARDRLRAKRQEGRLNIGLDPTTLADYAIIGAAHITNGLTDFTRWSAKMTSEFGNEIEDHLERIWQASNTSLDKNIEEIVTEKKKRPKARNAVTGKSLDKQREAILQRAGVKFQNSGDLASIRPQVQALALNFIRSGTRGAKNVVDKVHAAIEQIVPDITQRQTSDLISGYGDFRPLSKEEAKVHLRETKGELQQLSKLEDLLNDKVPLRTGVERREISRREKELIRRVNKLKQKVQPKQIDSERQLRTALQAQKARMETQIANLERQIRERDFAPRERIPIKLDREGQKLQGDLNKLKQQFMEERFREQLADRSTAKKVIGGTADVMRSFRAVMTSFDLSAPGRQGFLLALAHPVEAVKAGGKMFQALVDQRSYEQQYLDLTNRPNWELSQQAGLFIVNPNAYTPIQLEEDFQGRFANWIPGVKQSQRAYVAFLNQLRMGAFDLMVESIGRTGKGMDPGKAKLLANYINIATGRGQMSLLDKHADLLNLAFFSPRLMVSRFQYLAGASLWTSPADVKKVIAAEYAKTAIGLGTVLALGLLAGADVEDDPTSSDFGKLRFGKTRVDFLAGLQQAGVLLSRLGTGRKRTISGKNVELEGVGFGESSRLSVLGQFTRSKLNPIAGQITNELAGSDFLGLPSKRDFDILPDSFGHIAGGEAQELPFFVPMAPSDAAEALKEHGVPGGLAISFLAFMGFGAQTFDENKSKPKRVLK